MHDVDPRQPPTKPTDSTDSSAYGKGEDVPVGMKWLDSLLFRAAPAVAAFAIVGIALIGLASDSFAWLLIDVPLAFVVWYMFSGSGGKR